MPRRTATMLASTLLLIALLCGVVLIKVPYAEMSPGPTYNTLGEVEGEQVLSFPGKDIPEDAYGGHLNMTTVRVTGSEYRMDLFTALHGWLSEDDAVVPHEILYPEDKSAEEVDQQNAEEFSQSQESAKAAALKAIGEPVTARVVVQAVIEGGPSQGTLHAGDIIRSVDGEQVRKPTDVADIVTRHEPGEKVRFTVVPADEVEDAQKDGRGIGSLDGEQVTVRTEKAPEDGRAIVGIQPGITHTFPFRIDISLADVGGPSAGMMFALGIIDKLTPEDKLTGGAFVAGTGTIDATGRVGAIGGIGMKTIAAHDKGAEYFLTPAKNCSSALAHKPDGLTLVEVETLDDALGALEKIRAGETADLPRCGG
ncbi:PDZ domain-containing protein [Streptomyces sp. RKND-216]|uniref:YlbL family protein n=1 Tax=Streptomyces sp. RKND-216 TaxID=2562581 RepID=UPI00109E065E|nr:PDZ domain-containing protein [Streptomyces sp. RKND-216]THA24609.1 PDZ domain-containing protein [Streptomyces sp. RKND-216]